MTDQHSSIWQPEFTSSTRHIKFPRLQWIKRVYFVYTILHWKRTRALASFEKLEHKLFFSWNCFIKMWTFCFNFCSCNLWPKIWTLRFIRWLTFGLCYLFISLFFRLLGIYRSFVKISHLSENVIAISH